jgi:hypothetical protein
MKVTINDKVLSIPPHVSTTWDNVSSVRMKEGVLIVSLKDSASDVEVSGVDDNDMEKLFDAHVHYSVLKSDVEKEEVKEKKKPSLGTLNFLGGSDFPFSLDGGGLEDMGVMMTHNPDQSHAPDLPPELLSKIKEVSKAIGVTESMPKPEPHCNCVYCQIARSIHCEEGEDDYDEEEIVIENEEVTEEDLRFREWNVEEVGEKLYTVSNPFDLEERYQVYLGIPVGCTCGQKDCEHIKVVLRS